MTTIRLAHDQDAEALPGIEQSAGLAYRQIAELAWIADDENQSVERHRALIAMGTCWVAVDGNDRPIGFLSAEIVGDALHIWELDVRHDRQGSGIGRALLDKAIEDASGRGLAALTLTTFRHVAWNAPFYERLGFRALDDLAVDQRLADLLRREAEHGMPASKRCAMRLVLGQERSVAGVG